MLPDQFARSAPGLQHYDDMLTLTGRQFRFTGGGLSVGVVLGMLDARTGRLPIGLVDASNTYWCVSACNFDPLRWGIGVQF